MRRYDLLLLDADGTIFDFEAAERAAIDGACAAMGISIDAAQVAAYTRINADLWRAFERREVTQEALRVLRFARFVQYLQMDLDADAMAGHFVDALSEQAHEIPGAADFMREAASRVPIVVVTNGIASVQRARFARSPLRQWVRDYVISAELGVAKPDPRMITRGLELGGIPPERALMLGDSLTSDIAAANAARVDSCWYNPAALPNDTEHTPTHEIRALREALQWL